MSKLRIIKSVLKEYGCKWAFDRCLYSIKLKLLCNSLVPGKVFERKTAYPSRVDIFNVNISELNSFISGLSEEDKRILVETADKAVNGIIYGFSSIELDYGNPIDWQYSPLTGERCIEEQKWFQIPDFDQKRGDIKVIWEVSRFSHFITLARAYILTKNIKYYSAFSKQVSEWLEKNPYGYGANFKCGQECALRMTNALLAYSIFLESGVSNKADEDNIKALVDRCYKKILSNFFYAYKCIKNNHTISELMGMIIGAWCCCEDERLDKAFVYLDKVIDEQFTTDGGYCQYSFNYQRVALQDLECILSIEGTVGKSLSDNSKNKICKAALLMYQCQDESYDLPNYGSNDGALIFPVTSCKYRDFRPVINTVYALLTGKQLYIDDIHKEELIWFSNKKSINEYAAEKIERVSSRFENAGLFTIRDNDSWSMIVLNDYKTRPAHMDQLHFDLWTKGVNILCDCGTYSYADKVGKVMASNESHNTFYRADALQMNTHGSFMIFDWTKRIIDKAGNDFFEGTAVSKNGYTHSRRVEKRNGDWIITDLVSADGEILFHTACDIKIDNNVVILSKNYKHLCKIQFEECVKITDSYRSLYYLKKTNAHCISIKAVANKSIKTVISILEE